MTLIKVEHERLVFLLGAFASGTCILSLVLLSYLLLVLLSTYY